MSRQQRIRFSRVAYVAPPELLELGIASVPRPENEPVKERKRRPTDPFVPTEHKIQCKCVNDLRRLLSPGYIVHTDRAERIGLNQGKAAKEAGQLPGFPETKVFGDGRCFLIEFKRKAGKGVRAGQRSTDQKLRHKELREAGIPVLEECQGTEQAIEWLKANGARFRRFV